MNCWKPKGSYLWQSAAKSFTLERKVQRLHGVLSGERNTCIASDTLMGEDIVRALLKNRDEHGDVQSE